MSETLYAKTIYILTIVALFLFFVPIIFQVLTNYPGLVESIKILLNRGRLSMSEIDFSGTALLGLASGIALLLVFPQILKKSPIIGVLVTIYIIIVVMSAVGIVKA